MGSRREQALPVEASSRSSRVCVGRGVAFVVDTGKSKLTKVVLATGAAEGAVSPR